MSPGNHPGKSAHSDGESGSNLSRPHSRHYLRLADPGAGRFGQHRGVTADRKCPSWKRALAPEQARSARRSRHSNSNGRDHAVRIDFSEAMLEQARQRYPDIEFRQVPAESLPFEDAEFEVSAGLA